MELHSKVILLSVQQRFISNKPYFKLHRIAVNCVSGFLDLDETVKIDFFLLNLKLIVSGYSLLFILV